MRQRSAFYLHRHYFWIACVSSLAIFLILAVVEFLFSNVPRLGPILFSSVCLLVGYCVVTAGMWSVFGSTDFVKATLFAMSFLAIVLFGIVIGLATMDFANYSTAVLILLVSLLPTVVAAQMPFWFMRVLSGWQFTIDKPQQVSFSLKNMFAMTFIFGLAFSTPALVSHLSIQDLSLIHI